MKENKGSTTPNSIQEQNEGKYLTDLVKIRFKHDSFLSVIGKSICTVPAQCHQEILSSIRIIHLKNTSKLSFTSLGDMNNRKSKQLNSKMFSQLLAKQLLENKQDEEDKLHNRVMKTGELYHIEFYFTSQYLYYDPHQSKLILSKTKKTVFKIIEYSNKYSTGIIPRMMYDDIGNIIANERQYQIVLSDQPLYLKFSDQTVYLGTNDEKAVISFKHSLFKMDGDWHYHSLINTPCRLYSLEQEKFIDFNPQKGEMGLRSSYVVLQGMCRFQFSNFDKQRIAESPTLRRKKSKIPQIAKMQKNDKICIRIMRDQNQYYLTHTNHSTEQLMSDISRMIRPSEDRSNLHNTFFLKFEPSFSIFKEDAAKRDHTFNLSNMSMINQKVQMEEQEKQEIIEELSIRKLNYEQQIQENNRLNYEFKLELYPNPNKSYEIFIFSSTIAKSMKEQGKQTYSEKYLYLEYKQNLKDSSGKYCLKQYNNLNLKKQSSKYKNILRVQFITKAMLLPYVLYFQLLLNLRLYQYYLEQDYIQEKQGKNQKERGKLNLEEIQFIFIKSHQQLEQLRENDRSKAVNLLNQLVEIKFIQVIEELIEAIISKKIRQPSSKRQQYFNFNCSNDQTINIIANLIILIIKIDPSKAIPTFLSSKINLLLIRICQFESIYRLLADLKEVNFPHPKLMLSKIQKIINYIDQNCATSKCRNICILWGSRLMIRWKLESSLIERNCSKLLGSISHLNDDYLVILELSKLVKGDIYFKNQIINQLSFSKINQEEIPFALRQMYLDRIISVHKEELEFPFNAEVKSQIYHVIGSNSLQTNNKSIIMTFLQDILPKSNRFQILQNKLLALQITRLYLCFNEGIKEQIMINQLPRQQFLPVLINQLQQYLKEYGFDPAYKQKYVLSVLDCLKTTFLKYFRDIVWSERQNCEDQIDVLLPRCLKHFDNLSINRQHGQFSKQKIVAEDNQHLQTKSPTKIKRLTFNRESKKDERMSTDNIFQKGKNMLYFLFKRRETQIQQQSIIHCLDKELIWDVFNIKEDNTYKFSREGQFHLFNHLFEMSCMLFSPWIELKYEIENTITLQDKDIDPQFLSILSMLILKEHRYHLWNLVTRLNGFLKLTSRQWLILIAIINRNKLLKYFILFNQSESEASNPSNLQKLFNFLTKVFQQYLKVKELQDEQFWSVQIDADIIQVDSHYHHSNHECSVQNYIQLLSFSQSYYIKEYFELHTILLKSLGVVTNKTHYNFYQQYFIRYECQNYSTEGIKLILVFIQSLPPTLRTKFANNLQYSLFKQIKQLKELIRSVSEIKSQTQKDKQPQRRADFYLLTELNVEQKMLRTNQIQAKQSRTELLTFLFEMLSKIQHHSLNMKEIISKISFQLLYSIILKYNNSINLVITILNYICINIQKVISLRLNNYMKDSQQSSGLFELSENEEILEYDNLISWVKASNIYIQKEMENLKQFNMPLTERNPLMYIETLLEMVKLRDEVARYFTADREQKINRTPSGVLSIISSSGISSMKTPISEDLNQQSHEHKILNKARHLSYYQNSLQNINQNQLQNVGGINRLLCFELIQKLEGNLSSSNISAKLHSLLVWLEGNYKISLNSLSTNMISLKTQKTLIYKLDKTYLYSFFKSVYLSEGSPDFQRIKQLKNAISFDPEAANQSKYLKQSYFGKRQLIQYQKVNDFLMSKIQNYLVLLLELLQRLIISEQMRWELIRTNKRYYFQTEMVSDEQIIHVMELIELYLSDQIYLYQEEDRQHGQRNYEELPRNFMESKQQQAVNESEKFNQKCCKLQRQHLQNIFKLLLICHKIEKGQVVCHLHSILQKLTIFNIVNQINLQAIIDQHYQAYFEVLYTIINNFRHTSPIVNDKYFVFFNLQAENKSMKINELQQQINSKKGVKGYHLIALNFYIMLKMLISTSKTLNFNFKQLYSRPTIDKECILSELIDVLNDCVKNLTILTEDKLEFIRLLIKLINTLMRGPIDSNIQISINKGYYHILIELLLIAFGGQVLKNNDKFLIYIINIKKLIAEAVFILIPSLVFEQNSIKMIQNQLKLSYIRSKKQYEQNYQNIILDYTQNKSKQNLALLYFDLALHFYYCLIEIENRSKITRINEVQFELLQNKQERKSHAKTWMIFYQIYRIFADIFGFVVVKLTNKYQDLTDQRDQAELLSRSILFFAKNVSNIDVKVGNKIQRISFLLLKESKCYNISIRNQFHRLIGRDERKIRLSNFMSLSKYIIMRLQVEKSVRKVVQNVKPLELIILNRQLWKSLCFALAFLLNLFFIFENALKDIFTVQQFVIGVYSVCGILFIFIFFLFLIYFIQSLPLHIKVFHLINKNGFKMKSIIVLINDKTLGFALFYTLFIGLSFYNIYFCSVLMIDYFFRFKMSSKITFMVLKSSFKILSVIVLVLTLLYFGALLAMNLNIYPNNCLNIASCTQEQFYDFMDLRLNVKFTISTIDLYTILLLLPRFVLKTVSISLLVGLLYMQKRKEQAQSQYKISKIKDECFICGLSRNQIQKRKNSNKSFDNHVQMEHNLWNYIYYLIYLKNKDRKNLNTIENMIIEQWENNRIEWLPDGLFN